MLRRRDLIVLAVAALGLTACSTTTEIGGGATDTAVTTPTGDSSVIPGAAEACALSRDVLEVAAEAYFSINDQFAESAQQMVDTGLLMSAPDASWTYSYRPGDRDYTITATPGGPCD